MKIQSVTTKYHTVIKKNNKNSLQTKFDRPQQNNTQTISFGLIPPVPPAPVDPITVLISLVIAGLSMMGIAGAKDGYEGFKTKRKLHKQRQDIYKKLIEKDMKRYGQINNLNEQQTLPAYTNRLKKALVANQELNRKKVGLNSLPDCEVERFQLLLDVILPLNDTKELKKLNPAVPNGILINGKNKETNEKLINALKEHVFAMGVDVLEADLSSDNPQENLNNVKSTFDRTFKHHKKDGNVSLIYLKNIDNIMNADNMQVQDVLKNYLEESAKQGVVVLYDTTNPKQFNPALLRQGRTDVVVNVREDITE